MIKYTIMGALTAAFCILTPIAQATPDMCSGHADYEDLPNGPGQGSSYKTACGGKGGPDWSNNAQTPDNFPDTVPAGGSRTHSGTGGRVDSGTYDDNQSVQDEDGVQGHGNVTNSPLYVPNSVS